MSEAKSLGFSEESSSESSASRCVAVVLMSAFAFGGLSSLQADNKTNEVEIMIVVKKRKPAENETM